jgi:prepilin-type N-terminal cleavage/methylation domain-containing protein
VKEKMNKQKGFTLVEMLVVIAIIAILAGAVLLAINPVATMQKSRDTTRLNDMDALRSAINIALTEGEMILEDMTTTGARNSVDYGQQVDGNTGWITFGIPGEGTVDAKTGLGRYIPALPLDPTNDAAAGTVGLVYTFISNETDYEINCELEYPDNSVKMTTDGGDDDLLYEVGTSLILL